jgi:signal transduction histidine kinase
MDDRAYREAERDAQKKVDLLGEIIKKSVIAGLLLAFVTPVGVVLSLVWGAGLARRYYQAVLAPRLRERFMDEEVERRVSSGVSAQRREIERRNDRALEELSAQVAHELRNPIAAARGLVQQMGEDPSAPTSLEHARLALEELDRVERSISHLLRFAREQDIATREMKMSEVVESALGALRDRLTRAGVEVRSGSDGEVAMRGDPEKLRRVLLNLVSNACDALEQAGTEKPRIEVRCGENLARTEVWVRVRDNGPGMTDEEVARAFLPFATTKPDGTGLGLALSRRVVDAHGGTLEAHSRPGSGTEFLLTLPKQPPEKPAAKP